MENRNNFKKIVEKIFKKCVDNEFPIWYDNKVARHKASKTVSKIEADSTLTNKQ